MGNETSSVLSQFKVDESPILSTHGWSLHHAQRDDEGVTVFIGQATESRLGALETNLKLFRHPNVLRFISSCTAQGKLYLFTEKISPLSAVLAHQSQYQIVLGLFDVLTALEFLHERAKVLHNNLNLNAIFVTPNGRWKVGGMEFAKRFHDMNASFLETTRAHRHPGSIPPEESTPNSLKTSAPRDVYGMGKLAQEVLGKCSLANGGKDFLDFSEFILKDLLASDPDQRPTLKATLSHPIFQQDFLHVIEFLRHLPLKTHAQKSVFFTDLLPRLFKLPDVTIIGQQMCPLMLSRVVLLDPSAVEHVIPSILSPFEADDDRPEFDPEADLNPLLPLGPFKEHVVPLIQKIFHVRDYSVRRVLLDNFDSFCHVIPIAILEGDILPQLLLGMKDVDDDMVSSTLRALAELVPILGARIVVGKKQRKVFSDGTPLKSIDSSKAGPKQSLPTAKSAPSILDPPHPRTNRSSSPESVLNFPSHRHSPIGAEESEPDIRADPGELCAVDAWEDWGEESFDPKPVFEHSESNEASPKDEELSSPVVKGKEDSQEGSNPEPQASEPNELVKTNSSGGRDIDFFADMTPVIKERGKSLLEIQAEEARQAGNARFEVVAADEDGWDEDGWDNDEEELVSVKMEAKRRRVLDLLSAGMTVKEVMDIVSCSRSLVDKVKKLRQDGKSLTRSKGVEATIKSSMTNF
eukprot:maker-scaffold934_size79169-snap-gene-0.32 protein:Tk02410 transcript:maker-scaffold934_size79169-snap-gene-0.32-mRNA-1 annotation:"protein-associating with the carboxyl-terminal domain of ezrin"